MDGGQSSGGELYVMDTHALIWYLTDDKHLSRRARECFEKAEGRQTQVLIPVIVLFECLWLIKKQKIKISHIDEVLYRIEANEEIFRIVPLDKDAFEMALNIRGSIKDRDSMIVSIALSKKATLITKDKTVRKANVVNTLW